MKTTKKELDSLTRRYNECRLLCDSYVREIEELKKVIKHLELQLNLPKLKKSVPRNLEENY